MTDTEVGVRLTFPERILVAINRMGGRTKVADYFGVAGSTITRWTKGETVPPVMTLRALSMASGINYEWLRPNPNDPDPASVVHPPGLEPGTHWLRASRRVLDGERWCPHCGTPIALGQPRCHGCWQRLRLSGWDVVEAAEALLREAVAR